MASSSEIIAAPTATASASDQSTPSTDVDVHLRPLVVRELSNIADDVLQYTAGFVDAEGCFKIIKNKEVVSIQFTISQSLKGVDALHFIYDHFGGSLLLQLEGDEKNQRAYQLNYNGNDAVGFAKVMLPYLIVKKREALKIIEFPNNDTRVIPIIATNKSTNEVKRFETLKHTSEFFQKHLQFQKRQVIVVGDWEIRKSLTPEDITNIEKKRLQLFDELKDMKTTPYDAVSENVTPSDIYLAGYSDGDCTFDTHGKSGQSHAMTQKNNTMCEIFKRIFGGTIHFSKKKCYVWEIYTGADDFLARISPYVIGKKKQVDMIMAMKPGEALKVHAQLSLLKGKGKRATPLIDQYNAGNAQQFTPVRDLPKGVFKEHNKYRSQIQFDKKIYHLGKFDEIEQAEELYKKVKREITRAKSNGHVMDMSAYHVSTTKK